MKPPGLRVLQGLLWFACVSHLVIGGGILFSSEFQRTLAPVYSAELVLTPQLTYILRALGAFMLVVGSLAGVAACDPLRHRAIVYGVAGVLTLRCLQRVLFYAEAREGFNVNPTWYLAMGGFFLLMAVALVGLLTLASRPGVHPAQPAGRAI